MKDIIFRLILLLILPVLIISCREPGKRETGNSVVQGDTLNAQLGELNRRILSDSANPDAYYQRAKYYVDQRDVNKAFADIGKVIELNNKNADYFVVLSDIYMALGKIPSCLDALKRAEELDGKNNEAMLKLAEVYLILKDYQNCFEYTKRALELDLVNPVAYFIRGYAYMEQGDTVLAIKSFQVAADQDQNYYNAFIELGVLYSALKNPVATGYLQTAVRIDPNKPEGYYLLGLTYQEQENIPKAVETYEKLITIAPDYKEAYYNLGYINLVYTNDFDVAVNFFSKAISLDPKYADAYFNRGYAYELAGDEIKARADYQKALELVPNYERAITGLNRLDQ